MGVPMQARVKVGRKVRLNQEWLTGSEYTRWRGGPVMRVERSPTQDYLGEYAPLSYVILVYISSCQRLIIKTLKIIEVVTDLNE